MDAITPTTESTVSPGKWSRQTKFIVGGLVVMGVIIITLILCLFLIKDTATPTPTPIIVPTPTPIPATLPVATAPQVFNKYAFVTTPVVAKGAGSLTVDDATGFSQGQEVLLIQMQRSDGLPLRQENRHILSVVGNVISFSTLFFWSYVSNEPNVDNANVAQLVSVPNFTTVDIPEGSTVAATPWNGKTGGIVIFRSVGDVKVAGTIHTDGQGFRGGSGWIVNDSIQHASPGESFNGRMVPSGGGKAAADSTWGTSGLYDYADGGSGSYGTVGQPGLSSKNTTVGQAGTTYGNVYLSQQYYLGSGGGGTTMNTYNTAFVSEYPAGSAGGGAISILAGGNVSVSTTGRISANGGVPSTLTLNGLTVQGGSGSGGCIYISGTQVQLGTGRVSAEGGRSSLSTRSVGGAGRIAIKGTVVGATIPAHAVN